MSSRVAATDARRPCAGRAGSCARGGCRRPSGTSSSASSLTDLGTELRERTVVARREHPPARLALACRTPSRVRSAGRATRIRTTAPARLRATSAAPRRRRGPPCDRCTSTRSPPSNSTITYLPRRRTRSIVRAEGSAGLGRERLQRARTAAGPSASSVAPRDDLVEPFGERPDLRHLRHDRLTSPRARAAAFATISMHSSMPVAMRAVRHDARPGARTRRGRACSTGTPASTR